MASGSEKAEQGSPYIIGAPGYESEDTGFVHDYTDVWKAVTERQVLDSGSSSGESAASSEFFERQSHAEGEHDDYYWVFADALYKLPTGEEDIVLQPTHLSFLARRRAFRRSALGVDAVHGEHASQYQRWNTDREDRLQDQADDFRWRMKVWFRRNWREDVAWDEVDYASAIQPLSLLVREEDGEPVSPRSKPVGDGALKRRKEGEWSPTRVAKVPKLDETLGSVPR